MTNKPTELVVTQADRDAAAEAFKRWNVATSAVEMRQGRNDAHPLVQAFARHRYGCDWKCSAIGSSNPEPQDCSWPHCGCDPKATEVIEALDEHGYDLVDRHAAIQSLSTRTEELVKARLAFIDAVEDGLTWNSSQSQCLWHIKSLINTERALIASHRGEGS